MSTFASWLRIAGTHDSARQVATDAAGWLATRGVTVLLTAPIDHDYAQVDPLLELVPPPDDSNEDAPPLGLGYAGFSGEQRHNFLRWAEQPDRAASAAFHQLYCASLEVDLIALSASDSRLRFTLRELIGELTCADSWRRDPYLTNLWLLDRALNPQDTETGDVFAMEALAPAAAGTALGMQALRHEPLTPMQVRWLSTIWRIDAADLDPTLAALRLDEARQRGSDPLADALADLSDAALQPKYWRTAHRDLRLALPQPDLRSTLEPRLRDLFAATSNIAETLEGDESSGDVLQEENRHQVVVVQELTNESRPSQPVDTPKKGKGKRASNATDSEGAKEWQLIVEFSEGRSQYTPFALEIAQKLPGYATLLDENRTIVHRVYMRKSELRRFWRLWDYIQGWNSTHVYLNGKELEKWQVWPWSHYLR